MTAIKEPTDSKPTPKRDDSPAIWFFVAAVFTSGLPTFSEPVGLTVDPVITWVAAAGLTVLGFWAMFRKPRSTQ